MRRVKSLSSEIEITREMMEAVAQAQLYREDILVTLKKFVGKLGSKEIQELYNRVLQHPDFKKVKEDVVALEELTLIDENVDTILLYYNKLLRKAQFEGKYDVIVRILKEIRQIKAIEDEQMKFEVVIKVEQPQKQEK